MYAVKIQYSRSLHLVLDQAARPGQACKDGSLLTAEGFLASLLRWQMELGFPLPHVS